MTQKVYDPKLDLEVGMAGLYRLASCLCLRGLAVVIHPDGEKGVDLRVEKDDGKAYTADCEVRANWTPDWNDWPTPLTPLHVPYRKKKFIDGARGLGLRFVYFALRCDYIRGIMVTGEAIENSPVEEVKNKYCPEGEMFYLVSQEHLTRHFTL